MISWPVSSFTRYRVSGRISVTRPSNSISSSFAMLYHSGRLAMWDGIAARFDTTIQKCDATEIPRRVARRRGCPGPAAPDGTSVVPRSMSVAPAFHWGLGRWGLGRWGLGRWALGRWGLGLGHRVTGSHVLCALVA